MSAITTRWATADDTPAIRTIMALAIAHLQNDFLTPEQVVASNAVMGLDTQLIADGTYLLAVQGDKIVGCGGWSHRATLYGGDHSTDLRDPAPLDPARDPAKIRAMYTHPDHVRRGIGRLILTTCEDAARAAGFRSAEMMATLSGVPLYTVSGYLEVEHVNAESDGVQVPLIRMRKVLI